LSTISSEKSLTIVDVREAKTHFYKLLERAHGGETIVLAKAGKPYAKLVPLEARQERRPGALKGKMQLAKEFFERLPEKELGAWEQLDTYNNRRFRTRER
jgi:prevent-host-death family protein